jgi:hypothetical protein
MRLNVDEVDWAGLVCRIVGHSRPFQPAGQSVFICKRCRLAFGKLAPRAR